MTAIALDTGTRIHTRMYQDFFRSDILKSTEKLVFMALKNYLRIGSDEGDVYPSIDTLAEDVGLERKTIMRSLASMVQKGIITKIVRGGQKSNAYHIKDCAEMWRKRPDRSLEEDELERAKRILREAGYGVQEPDRNEDELEEAKRRLEEAGYKVEKPDTGASEKMDMTIEEVTEEHKKISDVTARQSITSEKTKGNVLVSAHISSANNVPRYIPKSQSELSFDTNSGNTAETAPLEKYPMDFIADHFGTSVLLAYGISQRTVDAAAKVIYDTLNTTRNYIRVAKVDRPASVVKSALLNLDFAAISSVLKKYDKIQGVIGHPDSYLLTLLYNALECTSAPGNP